MTIRTVLAWGVRFGAGVIVGIVLHYTLYRMSVPIEPFIYQAF
jgi:xanthosine utilization system XapX-like protein